MSMYALIVFTEDECRPKAVYYGEAIDVDKWAAEEVEQGNSVHIATMFETRDADKSPQPSIGARH